MIVRFRGKDGTYRVSADTGESFSAVIAGLEEQLPPHGPISIAASPAAAGEVANPKWDQTLKELGVRHGDMFFVSYQSDSAQSNGHASNTATTSALSTGPNSETSGSGSASAAASSAAAGVPAQLSKLDRELDGDNGQIPRSRSSLCSHGPKGMCEYCQPLESYDADYQYEHGIKHLSFWSWVKQQQAEAPSSAQGRVLEEPNYCIDRSCTNGHAPWPAGICSRCQPPTVTLQAQKFRMVDHVEFASAEVMSSFIEFWRQTGTQRAGFLIGRHERYSGVPLGVKTVVYAIWEPDQENEVDSLLLRELPTRAARDAASTLGLEVVGLVFTDLDDAGRGDGSVVTKRHTHSYFLSSLEILMAARMQNAFPYQTPLSAASDSSIFGSRFVTCVVSGNERGEIDVACYQASLQAQAMVKADLLCASTNPSIMRIQPPNDDRYVPDVFYKHRNEYGLVVQENAKPAFPVDYLLVSLTHGFPSQPRHVTSGFPIENRPALRVQSVGQAASCLQLNSGLDSAGFSDFHLLAYVLTLGVLQEHEIDAISSLLQAEQSSDVANETRAVELATELAHSPGIATLRAIAQT